MKDRGIPDAEIEAVFAKYDIDGDMVLNAEERKKMEEDLMKQRARLDKDIEVPNLETQQFSIYLNFLQDVKDRQESGEALGLGLTGSPEGEVSPISNDLLLEKLNKVTYAFHFLWRTKTQMFVTSDEFNILGKRVERMEQAVSNIVRKVFYIQYFRFEKANLD